MSLQTLMVNSCDIAQAVVTQSATGGTSVTGFTVFVSGQPCSIQIPSPDQAVQIYGKFDAIKQRVVYFNEDVDLSPVTDYLAIDGKHFQVHSYRDMTGRGKVWRCDCTLKPY